MLELVSLLLVGFIVGLSGAVIPGPLLAFVIFDSSRKRKMTGHLVIVGHAIWEAVIVCLIVLGLGSIMIRHKDSIYTVGGFALILMGAFMIKSRSKGVKIEDSKVDSSVLGGIFYTVFNPTQPAWWITFGAPILLQALELMGILGVVIFTMGHWLADLVYYALVSYTTYKSGKYINPWQRQMAIILGLFVAALGLYFTIQGLYLIA